MILLRPMSPSFAKVCVLTLKWLSASDIRRCRLLCRDLRHIIDTELHKELQLQYILLLDREGMENGSSKCALTVEDRLSLLKTQRNAWETLSPEAVVPLPSLREGVNMIPQPILNGPKFVYLDTRPVTSTPNKEPITCCDPYQGVLFTLDNSLYQFFNFGRLTVHVSTIKSRGFEPHPHASKHALTTKLRPGQTLPSPRLSVNEDYLSMYIETGERVIVIWNWKTGECVVHITINDWETKQTDRLGDFVFLPDSTFMLVGYKALYLYSLARTTDDWLYADAVLSLPPHKCNPDNVGDFIRCLTGPFGGALPRENTPFRLAPRERIHLLELYVKGSDTAAYVIINTAGLMRYIEDILQSKMNSGTHVSWASWGPSQTAIMTLPWQTRAIVNRRSIHGTRLVLSWMVCKDPPQYRHMLYDFTQRRTLRRTGSGSVACRGSLHMGYAFYRNRKGKDAMTLGKGDIFPGKIRNMLSFSVAALRPTRFRKYRQLMLGRDYILALRPTPQEVDRDASRSEAEPNLARRELEKDMAAMGHAPGTGCDIFTGDSQLDSDRDPVESCFFLF
ncbi:hypothetical protein PENSPDRAFT_750867 [Peniophora sp. CONT]|nr:hypothetical protein PENSPDRAFT_750867 [Peniophora sp. CONT]